MSDGGVRVRRAGGVLYAGTSRSVDSCLSLRGNSTGCSSAPPCRCDASKLPSLPGHLAERHAVAHAVASTAIAVHAVPCLVAVTAVQRAFGAAGSLLQRVPHGCLHLQAGASGGGTVSERMCGGEGRQLPGAQRLHRAAAAAPINGGWQGTSVCLARQHKRLRTSACGSLLRSMATISPLLMMPSPSVSRSARGSKGGADPSIALPAQAGGATRPSLVDDTLPPLCCRKLEDSTSERRPHTRGVPLRDSPWKALRTHLSQRSVWLCCMTRQSIWEAATCALATLPAGGEKDGQRSARGKQRRDAAAAGRTQRTFRGLPAAACVTGVSSRVGRWRRRRRRRQHRRQRRQQHWPFFRATTHRCCLGPAGPAGAPAPRGSGGILHMMKENEEGSLSRQPQPQVAGVGKKGMRLGLRHRGKRQLGVGLHLPGVQHSKRRRSSPSSSSPSAISSRSTSALSVMLRCSYRYSRGEDCRAGGRGGVRWGGVGWGGGGQAGREAGGQAGWRKQ